MAQLRAKLTKLMIKFGYQPNTIFIFKMAEDQRSAIIYPKTEEIKNQNKEECSKEEDKEKQKIVTKPKQSQLSSKADS